MQDEMDRMRRRDFLRLSATNVAVAGVDSLLSGKQITAQPEEPSGSRKAPAHPVVLRSARLEVTLDADGR